MTVAHGGKAVYGASVGMLLLETRFPRIPGDGGQRRYVAVSDALSGRR